MPIVYKEMDHRHPWRLNASMYAARSRVLPLTRAIRWGRMDRDKGSLPQSAVGPG